MTAAPLHTAALVCQESSVDLLIELGADPTVIEPRYQSDAMGWAREGGCRNIIRKVGEYLPNFLRKKYESHAHLDSFRKAVFSEDVSALQELLENQELSPELLNGPWFYFDAPAVVQAKKNLDLIDCLIQAGADINQKSHWWAGGFGVLDETEAELCEQLIQRGAKIDIWSAAALGRIDDVRALVEENTKRVNARGPDGKTPLHCAGSVGIAELLISQGAKLNTKCLDHDSTPAQYLVTKDAEVTRFLIEQGSDVDIMMAAVLGDRALADRVLAEEPSALTWCVDRIHFPSWAADTIYSWTLGWYLTPHQVAQKFEQPEMVEYMLEKSDVGTRFLNACLLGRKDLLEDLGTSHSDIGSQLSEGQLKHVCHAARNNQHELVATLLDAGFPVTATGQHEAMPLHWAAFHGNVEMAEHILRFDPPLEATDGDFGSTPLGWACHGAKNGWYKDTGDFGGVVKLLVAAGCQVEKPWKPIGNAEIDQLLASS